MNIEYVCATEHWWCYSYSQHLRWHCCILAYNASVPTEFRIQFTLSLCLGSPWSKPTIVNFNKLPKVTSTRKGFREFEHSALHVGDFNSYHSQWSYDDNSMRLVHWPEINNYIIVFDVKEAREFYSKPMTTWKKVVGVCITRSLVMVYVHSRHIGQFCFIFL